jgi:hypothetical protein
MDKRRPHSVGRQYSELESTSKSVNSPALGQLFHSCSRRNRRSSGCSSLFVRQILQFDHNLTLISPAGRSIKSII